jgi:hypothetical protein
MLRRKVTGERGDDTHLRGGTERTVHGAESDDTEGEARSEAGEAKAKWELSSKDQPMSLVNGRHNKNVNQEQR